MIKKYSTNQALIGSGFNQPAGTGFTLTLSGNTIIASSGTFQYATNRSSYFNVTPRAVPDVAYITGLTANINHVGSIGQIIYRGISGITGATGFIYNKATSGVTIPNLCISQSPVIQAGNYFLLTWDSGTTKVNKVPALSVTGIQGAINGLGVIGDCVCLGGTLIQNTCIAGDLYSFCINNKNNPIVIDNRCNGGIYLKSQCGISSSYFDDFTNSVGIAISKCNNGFKIFDCRTGANQTGIEYDNNYSAFFTSRSLVDKAYVDAIAAGLQPHPAVLVATSGVTDNRALSGLTGTTIVDGVVLSQGDRVLIKNQTDAKQNGIYILTGTTFTRAIDFNESSETVQGAYTFVLSGNTWKYTSWILSTPNPIAINVTPLTFSLFAQVTDILAGTGILITKYYGQDTVSVNGSVLAGNSLLWNNSTCNFDVNISGGTLATALSQTITGATNGLTKSGQKLKLGGTLTGSTVITDSRVSTGRTGIEYGGNYSASFSNCSLVTKEYVLTQMSSGGTYNLQSPAAICVGGISVGTVLTGKTAFQLFEELLVPTLYPAFVAPSESASISPSGTFEIGCNITTLCITGTFNRGTISPAYGTDGFRSGLATCYVFTGCQIASSYVCNASSLTKCATSYVVCASQTWTVSTCFSAGCQPKDSKGGNYGSVCGPGQTSAPTATITGIYPYYYGKLTSGSRPAVTNALVTAGCLAKCVLNSTGTVTVSFGSSASEYTWLAIPQTSTSKICWYVNALDNGKINNVLGDKYPDECVIAITSAEGCWTGINYKVYMSGAVGAISAPMEFRNS
jgi:hypothetical protein